MGRFNDVLPRDYNFGGGQRFSPHPRAHEILRHRDHARPIDDLSGEMQSALADAVIRQCGCDMLGGRYQPIKEIEEETDANR